MPAESLQNSDVSSAASLLYLDLMGFLTVVSGSKLTYSFLWSSPTAPPAVFLMLNNLCPMQPTESPNTKSSRQLAYHCNDGPLPLNVK